MVVVGGGWWANPLQTLPQGLVLTFDIDFDPDPDPELDKKQNFDRNPFLALLGKKIFLLLPT